MAPPGTETTYEPTRFVRCPFDMQALRGVDMSLCVGFEAEPVDDARRDSADSTPACVHLESAPHPSRDEMVGVCRHPEAPWVAAAARRRFARGDIEASSDVRRTPRGLIGTPALAARARAAQLRAALLVGRTRINAMCMREMPTHAPSA